MTKVNRVSVCDDHRLIGLNSNVELKFEKLCVWYYHRGRDRSLNSTSLFVRQTPSLHSHINRSMDLSAKLFGILSYVWHTILIEWLSNPLDEHLESTPVIQCIWDSNLDRNWRYSSLLIFTEKPRNESFNSHSMQCHTIVSSSMSSMHISN